MGEPSSRDHLSHLISEKIHQGELFLLATDRCWSGPATNQTCIVCGKATTEGVEREVESPDGGFVITHRECHQTWSHVSRELEGRSDSQLTR